MSTASEGHPDSESSRSIRVLCVDDWPDLAKMLSRLISVEDDMDCVGVLHSATDLVNEVRSLEPDIVILDLSMPGPSPIDALRELAEQVPTCRVIAHTGYDDKETRARVRDAGGWELVAKNGRSEEILDAIRRVAQASERSVCRS